MHTCSKVRVACIVGILSLPMQQPSWAGSSTREALAEELAHASLTDSQRSALEERIRLLDGLAQARPIPMPHEAPPGRAVGPGRLMQFDPATHLVTEVGASSTLGAGPRSVPGRQGAPLPGLGGDGGDGTSVSPPLVAGGCTPPPLDLSTWGFPWRAVVKLLMRFNVDGTDYFYVCSAATVSSFHLITAGHCMFNWDPNDDGDESDARWADEVWAWPAQTDLVDPFGCASGCPVEEDFPFGVSKSVRLYSYTGWTEDHDHDHDMAYIALDRRIGDRVGWMGAEAGVETASLNFDGYPTETPYVPACTNGPYPGYDENNVTGYTEFRIAMCAYTYGGHSGGPDWRYDGTDRFIQGVNSTSDRMGSAHATRLTVGKFDDLYEDIIPGDEIDIPPTARPELIEYVLELNAKDLLDNTVCQGTTFQIEYNGYNVGFESTGAITVDFYLSGDDCISDTDYLVGSVSLGSIGSNTFFNPTTTLTALCTVPPGTYYAGWIMSCATAEYNSDDNAVVIADETITVTETGPPAIALAAEGGDVDDGCVFQAPYSAVITDDCGVDVGSIEVAAASLDGLATVGTPTVDVEVISETEVRVSGTVEVSELTGCPADVRITVSGEDLCDRRTTRSVDIQVNDHIAPTITVELDRYELWPPNHKLTTITASVAASDNCPNTTWILQSVTSDEPAEGLGQGDTSPDIVGAEIGTADVVFQLRSERSALGDGRDYTIVYQVEDACGNKSQAVTHVLVPHDSPGSARAGSGFTPDGLAFVPGATTYTLVIPGTPELDVATIDWRQATPGNHLGVIAPIAYGVADVDGNGRQDLCVTFPVDVTRVLLAMHDLSGRYPVGFRYETVTGKGYWLADIFQLGHSIVTPSTEVPAEQEPVASRAADVLWRPQPNPFTQSTRIVYAVDDIAGSRVGIEIYSVTGRRVRTLAAGFQSAGRYETTWDGRDDQGLAVATGVYFYSLVIGDQQVVRRVTLTR